MSLPGDSDDKQEPGTLPTWFPGPDDNLPWDPEEDFGPPHIDPAAEEDKRASRLVKMESGARTLDSISRHVVTLALRFLFAGTAVVLVVNPDLVPWLRDILDVVLRGALDSGYGLTVPLIFAIAVFRKELTRLFRGRDENDD